MSGFCSWQLKPDEMVYLKDEPVEDPDESETVHFLPIISLLVLMTE